MTIYAAATVTAAAGVTWEYSYKGNTHTLTAGTRDIAVGTELTLTTGGEALGIYCYAPNAANANFGDAITSIEVTKDVTINRGWTVTLGEGLSATIGTVKYEAGDSFIAAHGQTLNGIVTLDAKVGTNVIKVPADGTPFVAATDLWTLASDDVDASVTLAAATKVSATGNATVTWDSGIPGAKPVDVLTTAGDVYVLPGTVLTANSATSVTGAGTVNLVGGAGQFTVGKDAITVDG